MSSVAHCPACGGMPATVKLWGAFPLCHVCQADYRPTLLELEVSGILRQAELKAVALGFIRYPGGSFADWPGYSPTWDVHRWEGFGVFVKPESVSDEELIHEPYVIMNNAT